MASVKKMKVLPATALRMRDVMRAFGVSDVTLYAWRFPAEGAAKKPMPHIVADNGHWGCDPATLKKWADKHGIAFAVDPVKIKPGSTEKAAPAKKVAKKAAVKPRGMLSASSAIRKGRAKKVA